MNRITKWMLKGVLVAAVSCTSLFATPILNFQGQTFNIAGGGQFTAVLSSDPLQNLQVYCVDFNNYINPIGSYAVNVSTLGDLSNTRYGNTAQAAFTYQTAPNGTNLGGAASRYSQAAWLISQYHLTLGDNGGARDIGIQNAIWNLLDTTGAHNTQGDWQTWMNNAAASGGLNNFRVFTTADVAGASGSNRYLIGGQEMIGIGGAGAQAPEPQSAVMMGIGGLMIGLGLARRRRNAQKV